MPTLCNPHDGHSRLITSVCTCRCAGDSLKWKQAVIQRANILLCVAMVLADVDVNYDEAFFFMFPC